MLEPVCTVSIIDWIQTKYGDRPTAPEIFRPFLKDLASPSPISALIWKQKNYSAFSKLATLGKMLERWPNYSRMLLSFFT